MRFPIPDIVKQFIIFCGVGSINTVVGLAVILVLSEMAGVHYILANFLGYGAGLILGFFLHKNITFKGQSDPTRSRSEFIKFVVVFAIAYSVQLLGLIFMVRILGIYEPLAQILAIGIYTILNYLGNRLITFQLKQEDAGS